jgi:hypothetical protein
MPLYKINIKYGVLKCQHMVLMLCFLGGSHITIIIMIIMILCVCVCVCGVCVSPYGTLELE